VSPPCGDAAHAEELPNRTQARLRAAHRSGGRQTAVIAATAIAMRFADAASAVSRVWGIVIASALP